jgi:hypothetical protein
MSNRPRGAKKYEIPAKIERDWPARLLHVQNLYALYISSMGMILCNDSQLCIQRCNAYFA